VSTLSSNLAGTGGGGTAGGPGGNGGAIGSSGALTVSGSVLSSNAAGTGGAGVIGAPGGNGGAIESVGALTLSGSTLSSNGAGGGGVGSFGGNGQAGKAGAVAAGGASAELTNDTVTDTATGGDAVHLGASSATLTNVTVARNGGPGINQAAGSVTLRNSLLASNAAGNCQGTVTDGGGNLRFPPSDTSCPSTFDSGDPKLAPGLHDNGGPTPTLALLPGSAGIDKVQPALCPSADQRGVGRPQGSRCDIGAFEFARPAITISSPRNGAHYAQRAHRSAAFACTEAGSRSLIASCVGTVANGHLLATSKLGAKSFTVVAIDKAGNRVRGVVHYIVKADKVRPKITLRAPRNLARYKKGAKVTVSYSCRDNHGGSGIASCKGSAGNGAHLNTSRRGTKAFNVRARDRAGNRTRLSIRYTIF
jgi:hypothetical protein